MHKPNLRRIAEKLEDTTVLLDLTRHGHILDGVPNYYRYHAKNVEQINCTQLILFSGNEKKKALRSKIFMSQLFINQNNWFEGIKSHIAAFLSFLSPFSKKACKLEIDYDDEGNYAFLLKAPGAYVGYLLSERRHIYYHLLLGRFSPVKEKFNKKIDIFHAPCFGQPTYKKDAINVITIHDQIPIMCPHTQNTSMIRFTHVRMKKVFKYYQYFFFVSRSAMDDSMKLHNVPEDRCIVTYLPIRVISEQANNSDKFIQLPQNLQHDDYWLFVSRPAPSKNIDRVIEAFYMSGSKKKLVLAVSHPYKNSPSGLKKLLKIAGNSGSKITVIVNCSDSYLNSLYKSAFGLLHPSLYEGFGMTIAEAMYFGCPVITSNVASMPEVAAGAALLVNPYSLDEISEAIQRVEQDDSLRNEMIALGKKRAEDFSDENYQKRIATAYQYVLDHAHGKLEPGTTFDTYFQEDKQLETVS